MCGYDTHFRNGSCSWTVAYDEFCACGSIYICMCVQAHGCTSIVSDMQLLTYLVLNGFTVLWGSLVSIWQPSTTSFILWVSIKINYILELKVIPVPVSMLHLVFTHLLPFYFCVCMTLENFNMEIRWYSKETLGESIFWLRKLKLKQRKSDCWKANSESLGTWVADLLLLFWEM